VYARVLQQSGTPAQVPRHQNPLITDVFSSAAVAIAIFARPKEKKNTARKYELHYLIQARSSSPLQCSTDQEFRIHIHRLLPPPIHPTYYQNCLPSAPSLSRSRRRCSAVDVYILATTAMQAVLLGKRASKTSDPLDRDPTVGHI
jgi:hypothetical protein